MDNKATSWRPKYEWKVVTLLSIGFGPVELDRRLIAHLLPSMIPDLKLHYQDRPNEISEDEIHRVAKLI